MLKHRQIMLGVGDGEQGFGLIAHGMIFFEITELVQPDLCGCPVLQDRQTKIVYAITLRHSLHNRLDIGRQQSDINVVFLQKRNQMMGVGDEPRLAFLLDQLLGRLVNLLRGEAAEPPIECPLEPFPIHGIQEQISRRPEYSKAGQP